VFTIVTTEYFLRRARKFLKKHPDLRERFAQVVDDLRLDPFAPHLAYHRLGGKLKDFQAVSITYDYRIILTLEVTEREVILLDIGSHDEVYR
jgi:mRNA-degrading endonuclease YafQ of YafQ-DinJ toxin-antitoxin module